MTTFEQRRLVEIISEDGRVESKELEALRSAFGDGSQLMRDEADALAEMFKRVERRNPAFEDYFYRSIKNYVRAQKNADAELADWLRRLLSAKCVGENRRVKLLHELQGEMKNPSPEFQALFDELLTAKPAL